MYKIITEDNVECAFPDIKIASDIFSTLMVTNCSAKRQFFQQKCIKNSLRTSKEHRCLNSLSILGIEANLLRKKYFYRYNFNRYKDFAVKRSRKNIQVQKIQKCVNNSNNNNTNNSNKSVLSFILIFLVGESQVG